MSFLDKINRKHLAVLLLVAVLMIPVAYALGIYSKQIAAIGIVEITDEVTIVDIQIDSATQLSITMAPNQNTVAEKTYTVKLFLDGKFNSQKTVSWTQGEINQGKTKTLIFSANLQGVSVIKFEVLG